MPHDGQCPGYPDPAIIEELYPPWPDDHEPIPLERDVRIAYWRLLARLFIWLAEITAEACAAFEETSLWCSRTANKVWDRSGLKRGSPEYYLDMGGRRRK